MLVIPTFVYINLGVFYYLMIVVLVMSYIVV